jgi:Trk K+ transport system NAD-binding subunit
LVVSKKRSNIDKGALVASLRRGRRLIIPHGDTTLEAGDHLAIVVEEADREAVHQIVNPGPG